MRIAPTRMIPWIAFAPDISGVCSTAETFEMTSKPTKIDSMKMVSKPTLFTRAPFSSTHDPVVNDHGARDDLVVKIWGDRAVLGHQQQQVRQVARVKPARVKRHAARHVAP